MSWKSIYLDKLRESEELSFYFEHFGGRKIENKYSKMNREELSKLKIDIDNKTSKLPRKDRDLIVYYYNLKR